MHLMLLINGYDLASNTEEEIDMTKDAALGKMHETEITRWLKQHSKKKSQEKQLQ